MLENTAHATDKVPNILALVASQMVVEKAKEFREQARQAAEQARKVENARLRDRLLEAAPVADPSADASSKNDTSSEPAPSQSDAPAQPDPRGTVVDLNV